MENRGNKYKKETKAINLMIILMRSIGMWHVSSKKEKILSNIMLGILLLSMIVSFIVEADEIYYAKGDLMQLTYIVPCASTVCSEFSKLLVFIVKRQKVMNLNKFVDERFWKVEYDKEDRKIFNECGKVCFQGITLYVISLQGICWHYLLVPLLESIGKNASERQFPFPIYFNFPITETPYYQVIFSLQVFGTLAVCLCSTTFASYLFAINMFMAAQFKMLNAHLQLLCDFAEIENIDKAFKLQAEARHKLKNCIRKHQLLINYINEIENLYCFAMLGQVFGSVTQICFSGFQVLLSNATETPLQRTILSGEYLLGSFMQLYFYCYSSHMIFIESQNVSQSMYSTKWFKVTCPMIRKDFSQLVQIIVHRARRPCILSVGKFCPLTLDTFSSVLSTSLSYFTVLRQTIE